MAQAHPIRSSKPAVESIYTRGNAFYRGNERFLIKGISYDPVQPGSSLDEEGNKIDPLADRYLEDLKRDIAVFHELGLNTIQLSILDLSNNHDKAMNLLANAGIHVFVRLCEDMKPPELDGTNSKFGPDFDTAPHYPVELLMASLRIVDKLADYPNLLGFVVCAHTVNSPATTKIAEVSRAAIADIKHFLRLREGRSPPVGVGVQDLMMFRLKMLQYFTAGPNGDRVDFFAPDSWTWVNKSSFRISGWESMVNAYSKFPVPMFLAAYGAVCDSPRRWDEVECLYSPDMTGVFSGGCLFTYFERTWINGNDHGIVRVDRFRTVHKKPEFKRLKKHFDVVNTKSLPELHTAEVRDYENWHGEFPSSDRNWYATPSIPTFTGSWTELLQDLQDERDWELLEAHNRADTADNATTDTQTQALLEQLANITLESD